MNFHIHDKTVHRFIYDTFAVPAFEERGIHRFDVFWFWKTEGRGINSLS